MRTLFDILDEKKQLIEKCYDIQQEELKTNAPLKQQKRTYREFEKQMKKLEKEEKKCLKNMKNNA